MSANSVASALTKEDFKRDMKNPTKNMLFNCEQRDKPVRKGTKAASSLRKFNEGSFECWICLEELGSQALLVKHYDNHMTIAN